MENSSCHSGLPPFGVAPVERHVYQGSRGGKTYCPPGRDARIVVSPTPKFAKMASREYAESGPARVIEDLAEDHGRVVARRFARDTTDAVAAVAMARGEEREYALPEPEGPTSTITIGIDGACPSMCEDGRREAMVGTIGLHDAGGERRQTIDLGATPEDGEATLLGRMGREIERVKASHPEARHVGLADGAKGNRELPGRHTEVRMIDFWHAAESLSGAGDALFAGSVGAKRPWLEASCDRLSSDFVHRYPHISPTRTTSALRLALVTAPLTAHLDREPEDHAPDRPRTTGPRTFSTRVHPNHPDRSGNSHPRHDPGPGAADGCRGPATDGPP